MCVSSSSASIRSEPFLSAKWSHQSPSLQGIAAWSNVNWRLFNPAMLCLSGSSPLDPIGELPKKILRRKPNRIWNYPETPMSHPSRWWHGKCLMGFLLLFAVHKTTPYPAKTFHLFQHFVHSVGVLASLIMPNSSSWTSGSFLHFKVNCSMVL